MSTVGNTQYRGGYHDAHGWFHEYRGEYHPLKFEYRGGYHEYRGGCSVPWGTQITKDFPPTVLNNPHGTAHTLYRVLISGQQSDSPLRETTSVLSGKYKRFTFVHPVTETIMIHHFASSYPREAG